MKIEDYYIGRLLLVTAGLFIVYYTTWVIVLPFVHPEYQQHFNFIFPPVEWALGVPALLSSIAFTSLLARAYYLVLKDRRAKIE